MIVDFARNPFYDFARQERDLDAVQTILDVGSYDGRSCLPLLLDCPNASLYAFEANPSHFAEIQRVFQGKQRSALVPKAVSDIDEDVPFCAIDPAKTKITTGASSMLTPCGYWEKHLLNNVIEVPSTRLDTWAGQSNVGQLDFVWMDLQGVELRALQGAGSLLKTVRILQVEVIFDAVYSGQTHHEEMDSFLKQNNFELIAEGAAYADGVWRYPNGSPAPWSDRIYRGPASRPASRPS